MAAMAAGFDQDLVAQLTQSMKGINIRTMGIERMLELFAEDAACLSCYLSYIKTWVSPNDANALVAIGKGKVCACELKDVQCKIAALKIG